MVRSGKELKTKEGKARARGRPHQENAKVSQNLKSWPLGASKIQHCVIFGSSLTRRLQGSCHRSDSKRTKGPLSDNVFISRLLLNFFIDIFLYSILFYMFCLLGSQCDRMLAISYYELSFIASNLTTWGLRSLWWWFWPHHHFSSSASSLSCYWMFALS